MAISATVHARPPCTTQPVTPSPPARRGFLVHATSSFSSDASPRATASRGSPVPHLGRPSHCLWSTPALARSRRCFPFLSTAPLSRVAAGGGTTDTCQVDPSCVLICPQALPAHAQLVAELVCTRPQHPLATRTLLFRLAVPVPGAAARRGSLLVRHCPFFVPVSASHLRRMGSRYSARLSADRLALLASPRPACESNTVRSIGQHAGEEHFRLLRDHLS